LLAFKQLYIAHKQSLFYTKVAIIFSTGKTLFFILETLVEITKEANPERMTLLFNPR